MERRTMLAAGALALAATPALAQQPAASPKTYVLVHGAWGGGWIWKHTAEGLRAKGHRVFTPTQTGLGERKHLMARSITIDTFVEDIAAVLQAEELRDVILVGHSFGGFAVTGVADRMPDRIRHLVYLDALLPENGDTAFAVLPPGIEEARRRTVAEQGGGVALPVPPLSAFPLPDEVRAWFGRQLAPHPFGTYDTPLRLKAPPGAGRPVTYVSYTNPPLASIEPSRQRARAKQAQGWRFTEMDVPHDAQAAVPERIIALLDGIN
ncbi:alpha/beta hydrolase [Sabulicella glaciei]|uniref:Alpha/beta hydrolase n=1 Tax=Sabulicella glaciei TaxID=2984948 RepID=A0ABT3NXE9_9PROT|nr:alpha/beta fold hydrolase [Roseococcus sp. MDT2-1-1]MCW8086244.1 alpha/beta hydrolase [Roseococcus sp. MDT2-1-1]